MRALLVGRPKTRESWGSTFEPTVGGVCWCHILYSKGCVFLLANRMVLNVKVNVAHVPCFCLREMNFGSLICQEYQWFQAKRIHVGYMAVLVLLSHNGNCNFTHWRRSFALHYIATCNIPMPFNL